MSGLPSSVLLIGLGSMGKRHLRVIKDLGLPLAGICDRSDEVLRRCSEEFAVDGRLLFKDAFRAIESTTPGCVVISTTAPSHSALTLFAAERKVPHILCEKPMATSLSECDAMIAACKTNGTKLAINHQMRFMDHYVHVKAAMSTDSFGGLTGVTVVAGNIGLAMNAPHYFELFRFLAEEESSEVTAWFSRETVPNPRGAEFEDRAGCVRTVTPSGKRLYLDASFDQCHGVKIIFSARHGQLVVDDFSGSVAYSHRDPEYRSMPSTRYGCPSVDTRGQLEPKDVIRSTGSVLQALLRGTGYPTGEDGRHAIEVLVGAYVSAENGNAKVDLTRGNLPRERHFPWA